METLTFDTFPDLLMRLELGKHRPPNSFSDTLLLRKLCFVHHGGLNFTSELTGYSTTDPVHE